MDSNRYLVRRRKAKQTKLKIIQDRMDKIRLPPNISRIPRKVTTENSFSHFTANQ